jgi:hypothetical protein
MCVLPVTCLSPSGFGGSSSGVIIPMLRTGLSGVGPLEVEAHRADRADDGVAMGPVKAGVDALDDGALGSIASLDAASAHRLVPQDVADALSDVVVVAACPTARRASGTASLLTSLVC